MANSRELAEQAFSLLQDALQDSEARAAKLDTELKKKQKPKSQLENQAEILQHRLETAEAEREKWQREAAQFEEILENERARIQQLKKKLEVAESGPDKVGKKEVNYWRARAELFDEETKEYKRRIGELRKAEGLITLVKDLKSQNGQLHSDLADKNSQLQETQDRVAGLEEELKEEKDCTVDLSEIANERREKITELSEKLEEAQERHEDAEWHLARADRFEQVVAKRRKLIGSLIAGHRAKHKSNAALKAGLDGLRKFKARSERQQQKMLMRIEELSAEIKEAEERLADREGARKADEKLRRSEENISELEERLSTQVEIIDNLESELNAAKATRQTAENRNKEISELKIELVSRNETITRLEADLDDQQKHLGKLRGSESETMRLRAVKLQDMTLIDELQTQVDALKADLTEQQKLAEGGAQDAEAASTAEIRKRDSQISDLRRAMKDQDKEIDKLNEAVVGWKKKYEFVTTEAPSAYQPVAAEK